jgi:RNA polymerase sigma-70 factor (ECF subfamily)
LTIPNVYIRNRKAGEEVLLDEKHLIRIIQKRADKAAADTLVRMYYDEIAAYAYKQTSDTQRAMDLTQDIFITALRAIVRYDSRQASFRTWLYKIATNKIIDYHRSRSKVQSKMLDSEDFDIPDDENFVRQLENEDLACRIQEHAGTFDAETQRIFRLKIFGEYTFSEIADITEMPEATVKTKYYRMIKNLRKEFSDEYYT